MTLAISSNHSFIASEIDKSIDLYIDLKNDNKNIYEWYDDFKNAFTQPADQKKPVDSFVTNSIPCLMVWSGASTLNAIFNLFGPFDRELAQTASTTVLLAAVSIDIAGTQNGYANLDQRKILMESVRELVTAVLKGKSTKFELMEITNRCANNLRAAEALPGALEFVAKIGTDAVSGFHQIGQFVLALVNTNRIQTTARGMAELLTNEQDKLDALNMRSVEKLDDFLASGKIPDDKATNFFAQAGEQKEHFSMASTAMEVGSGIGIVTGLANFSRGVFEWFRLNIIGKTLDEQLRTIHTGIQKLAGAAGTEVLKHHEQIALHRKSANRAARVGAIARIFNGLWGIISRIALLAGAVIVPWIAPLITACVVLIYAIKNWVQLHYTRQANRLANQLANTIKSLSKVGTKKFEEYLHKNLVDDLKALAKGGKELWEFLKAMGRPELIADVKKLFRNLSSIKDRFPVLKKLIDICTSASPDIAQEKLEESNKGSHQLTAALVKLPLKEPTEENAIEEDLEPSFFTAEEDAPSTTGLSSNASNFSPEGIRIFQKFMGNKLEKIIASRDGKLKSLRLTQGDPETVKRISGEAIKALAGDTPVTATLLAIIDGLVENKNNSTRSIVSGLVKGRTWSLTKHAQNCESALESQNATQLTAPTLAAALTESNAEAIVQCRFAEASPERDILLERLNTSNLQNLKATVDAVDEGNGKKLLELARLDPDFQGTLKTALMLFGHPSELASAMVATLGSRQGPPAACAEDWSHALGLMSKKQMHATFKDGLLLRRIWRHMAKENEPAQTVMENTLVVIPASPGDPRLQKYIDAIATGRIPFQEVPEWLLGPELRLALNHKAPKSAHAEAFREQLKLSFFWHKNPNKQGKPPVSLRWGVSAFYGHDESTAAEQLKHSFQTMLGIDASASNLGQLLEAARLYAAWEKKDPAFSDIQKMVAKGGLCAAVALHCATNLQGISVLSQTGIQRIADCKTVDDIKIMCVQLIQEQHKLRQEEKYLEYGNQSTRVEAQATRLSPWYKLFPPIEPLRRRSLVTPSHTQALLERREEERERDSEVEIKDRPNAKRQNSEGLSSTINRSSMLEEIDRRRGLDERIAGGASQDRLPEEGMPPIDNAEVLPGNNIHWMQGYADAAHVKKATLDKATAKLLALSDQPLSTLSAD